METAAVRTGSGGYTSAFRGRSLGTLLPKASTTFLRPVPISNPKRCNLKSKGAFWMPVCESKQNDEFQHSVINKDYMMERFLLLVGLDHHSAQPRALKKLAISYSSIPQAVGELTSLPHVIEAAIISTCNRFEIHAVAFPIDVGLQELSAWVAEKSGIPVVELQKCYYVFRGRDAARRLFEVTAGLNSLLLGNQKQILAQVRETAKCLDKVEGFGRIIKALFEHAVSVGEQVRSETNLTVGSDTFGSAAVELVLMKFLGYGLEAKVLVIGVGTMGSLVIKHLVAKGYNTITVVNWTEGRVSAMRDEVKGAKLIYMPVEEMVSCIGEADIVFACVESPSPFILKEHVGKLNPGLKLFVDTSIPESVDESVSQLPFTRVYNISDIEEVRQTQKERGAETCVEEQMHKFQTWMNSVGAIHALKLLWSFFKQASALELENTLLRIGNSISEDDKIEWVERESYWSEWVERESRSTADKFIHSITHMLKKTLGSDFSKLINADGLVDEECSSDN